MIDRLDLARELARREAEELRADLTRRQVRLEQALRDLNVLLDGGRILEEILTTLARRATEVGAEPGRPHKPSRTTDSMAVQNRSSSSSVV